MEIATPPVTGLTGAFQGIFIEPLHTEESILFSKGEEAFQCFSPRERRHAMLDSTEEKYITPLFPQAQGGPSVGSHFSPTRSSITYLSPTAWSPSIALPKGPGNGKGLSLRVFKKETRDHAIASPYSLEQPYTSRTRDVIQ